jgi:hypothetical protein
VDDDDGTDDECNRDGDEVEARIGVTPSSLTDSRFHRCGDANAANGVSVCACADDDDGNEEDEDEDDEDEVVV